MPKRLRIGQPTGLWKEEMETGTNDPTILQAGNGRSTTEISVTQALDSLDSLDSPIGFSTCSQFAVAIPRHPLLSLTASMSKRRGPRPPRPQCLPSTLQLALGELAQRQRHRRRFRNDLSPRFKTCTMLVVSHR